jgi:1L-myo-inositol 1-phosphate cytidylyltransferase / CDP-L-myo-inositol myo-inositolphosphotransferase
VTAPPSPFVAIIDTTSHPDDVPPETIIGGLSLLERALRLAEVCGFDRAIVLCPSASHPEIGALVERAPRSIPVEIVATGSLELAARFRAVDAALPLNTGVRVWYASSTVYERRLINAARAVLEPGLSRITLGEDQAVPDLAAFGPQGWQAAATLLAEQTPRDFDELFATSALSDTPIHHQAETGWFVRITSRHDTGRAEDALWRSCRKEVDGLVARHINRYISLAISRRIASTGMTPNHVSILTFALGIIAALFAAIGGYWAFFAAGLLYQINSVIDGVDGELARTKYQFSLLGEWLDTLSDDFSDLFIYIGLGVGAWRTVGSPFEFIGPELWLVLATMAAVSKVVTMGLYYRWLIAHKRGDLLSFQWSFEASDEAPSPLARALRLTKYFFKKDFIVFVAMLMGFVGLFPFLLFLFGPGNLIVAISVAAQSAPASSGQKAT